MKRLWRLLVLSLLVPLVLTACAQSTPEPRLPTATEAEGLATARFNNFNLKSRELSFELTANGQSLDAVVWINYVEHVGVGLMSDPSSPQDTWALLFSPQQVAIAPLSGQTVPKDAVSAAVAIPPAESAQWQVRELDASASTVDALLRVLLDLGDDRPENPLLLAQGGAIWLGNDAGQTHYAVLDAAVLPNASIADRATASPLQITIDDQNVMRKVEVLLGLQWVRVDLTAGATDFDFAPWVAR